MLLSIDMECDTILSSNWNLLVSNLLIILLMSCLLEDSKTRECSNSE